MKIISTVFWLIAMLMSITKAAENTHPAKHGDLAQYGNFFEELLSKFGTKNASKAGSHSHDDSASSQYHFSSEPSVYGASDYKNIDYGSPRYDPSGYNTRTSDPTSYPSVTTDFQGFSTEAYVATDYHSKTSSPTNYHSSYSGSDHSSSKASDPSVYYSKDSDMHTPGSTGYQSAYGGIKDASTQTEPVSSHHYSHTGSEGFSFKTPGSTGYNSVGTGSNAYGLKNSGSSSYHSAYSGSMDSSYQGLGSTGYHSAYSGATGSNTKTAGYVGYNPAGYDSSEYGSTSYDTTRVDSTESHSEHLPSSGFDFSSLGNYGHGFPGHGSMDHTSSGGDKYGLGVHNYDSFNINPPASGEYTGLNRFINPGALSPTAVDKKKKDSVEQVTWKNEYQGTVDVEHRIKDDGNFSDSSSSLYHHAYHGNEIVNDDIFGKNNKVTWTTNPIPGSSVHIKYPDHKDLVKTKHAESKKKIQHEIHTIEVVLENNLHGGLGAPDHGKTSGKAGDSNEFDFKGKDLDTVIQDCWDNLPTCPHACQNTTRLCEKIIDIAEWPKCLDRVEGIVDKAGTYFKNGVWKVFSSIGGAFSSVFG